MGRPRGAGQAQLLDGYRLAAVGAFTTWPDQGAEDPTVLAPLLAQVAGLALRALIDLEVLGQPFRQRRHLDHRLVAESVGSLGAGLAAESGVSPASSEASAAELAGELDAVIYHAIDNATGHRSHRLGPHHAAACSRVLRGLIPRHSTAGHG
jgi:hypothetical protein